MIRVAINGFGRIGRSVYRILSQRDDVDVAVVNDLASREGLAYLLRYDTVMGAFPGEVRLEEDSLRAGSQVTRMTAVASPDDWDWKGQGIDIVDQLSLDKLGSCVNFLL